MSSLLSAEISATCSALGYFDEKTNKYYADSNTLETVKDLIRYLRRDDEVHTIRRQLGETKVLITDLLPLLKSYHEENDLFDVLLRLIMNLTTPPLLLYNFDVPTDKLARNNYLELEDNLKSYKEAFVDEGIWAVFSTHMSKIFEVDSAERGEENSVKIERILVLIRNILFVPADSLEKRPDNDASIHDQVLWALHHSGLLDIILYITTNPAEQAYYMYILEIMFFMLKGQQPNELANAALQRSQGEKVRDEAELVNIRHSESNEKQKKMKIYMGARHSRFGGTFVVKNLKSITDNELISHKPLNKLDALNFDANKRNVRIPKNRRPVISNTVDRRSAFTIRLFLKEFCIEFLNGAYNSMMQYVKSILVRSDGDKHDESYYLWALSFFMAFNRYYKFEVKLVSETLSVQAFYYVQQQSENYLDLIKKDRKKFLIWSTRLHTALLSYKELLSTLFIMDKSNDQVLKDSSKVIKSNVFYITEYREFILTLLIMYDELKMSNHYLKDLMETQHLFLKMFEAYCKDEGCMVVKKKSKSKKKKSKKAKNNATTEIDLDEMWDKVSPQLSVTLEAGGEFLTEYVPFDAASDVPIDEQKFIAMKKIQHQLRNSNYEGAIGIMRAAREVWPENNSFGSDNMTSEEEFLSLREIFYADLGENLIENASRNEDNNYDDDDDEEEDEEEGDYSRNEEVSFTFKDFLHRLPHPKIIRTCGLALRYFETNSVNTNHSILKLMHRIAFDCKSYVMMFQLSLFRTFQKIFRLKDLPQYKELTKFAIYILRQFFKIIETNNKLYIEILFWTQKKDAYEIENGYGSFEKSTALWSEEEMNELRVLFEEYQNKQIEEDVVDWILKNLINQTRTRRMVLVKLKAMSLLDDYKKPKKASRTNSVFWTTEEETLLRELHAEFKDSPDPLGSIMHGLRFTRPKNKVIDKLLTLGLIEDKSELKKKRKTVKKGSKKSVAAEEDDFSSSDSDSDSPPTASTSVPVKTKSSQKKRKMYPVTADNKIINSILLENIKAGRQDALRWLRESVDDVIDDFEEDHEGIPLVPLADYAENAMDNKEFQKLLLSLGFTEPFDEQESYWRIPGHISIDTLKSHSELIMSALDNNMNDTNGLSETGLSQENAETTSHILNEIAVNNANDELLDSSDEINDHSLSVDIHKDPKHQTVSITEETNDCDQSSVSKRHRSISESDNPPGKRSKTDDN